MEVALYTLICEYANGTYVAQASARSPKSAILSWLDARSARKQISEAVKLEIRHVLDADLPVPLDNCRNVWCCTASSKKGLVQINVVKTSSTLSQAEV